MGSAQHILSSKHLEVSEAHVSETRTDGMVIRIDDLCSLHRICGARAEAAREGSSTRPRAGCPPFEPSSGSNTILHHRCDATQYFNLEAMPSVFLAASIVEFSVPPNLPITDAKQTCGRRTKQTSTINKEATVILAQRLVAWCFLSSQPCVCDRPLNADVAGCGRCNSTHF